MAKKQYGSVLFPFDESEEENQVYLKRTENVNDTVKSAIRAFLLTKKYQRRGNTIGSVVADFKHTLIQKEALYIIQDEVKQELNEYFSGISFPTIEITQKIDEDLKVPTLYIEISFALPGKELESLSLIV